MIEQPFPTVRGISAAVSAIDPLFLSSPMIEFAAASAAIGCRLMVKVESLNPLRCFKGRGVEWWMANLPASDCPVVTASAGNFGQAVAYSAAKRRRRSIVFASKGASPTKIQAMKNFGAEVVLEGHDFDAAKDIARGFAKEHGFLFVEDGAERLIAEGAGTIGKEITEALAGAAELNAILIPVGNGALITGLGTWIKAILPSCKVIGVVASGAPAMKLSWEADAARETATVSTIADGISVRVPVAYALRSMRGIVDQMVEVGEADIERGMQFCSRYYGLVAEPAAAVGFAALIAHPELFREQMVATVLSGSNVRELG